MVNELELLRLKCVELQTRLEESEKKRLESETRFNTLFHASSNPISISSVGSGCILDLNRAYAKLSGLSREEIIGTFVSEHNIWTDLSQRDELVRKLHDEGRIHNFRIEMQVKAGEIRTVLLSIDPITVNEEPCWLTALVDITEREKEANALRESEEKYRTLIDNSLQGLAIIQDSRVVFCNKKFADITGYSVEELISLSSDGVKNLAYGMDQKFLWDRHQERLAGKPVPSRYEHRAVKKDGTEIWVELCATLTQYRGRPAIQTAYLDITERKQAEALARESSERLLLALQGAGMASFDWNVQSGEIKNEEQWLKNIGHLAEGTESNLRRWQSEVHPDDRESIRRAYEAHAAGKTPFFEVEYRFRHKSGSWVWVLDRGKIVAHDSAGQPLHVLGVHIDITEHKQAMEQLRQLALEQRVILNTISLGICYLKQRKVQWVNPALANMLGYSIDELGGLDTSLFFANRENYQRVGIDGYGRLAKGSAYSIEIPMKKKDGSSIWCSISGQAIAPENPESAALWILQDITDRRHAEEALRASEERFKRLVQNSNDIITVVDDTGIQISVSGPVEKIFGHKPEELVGTSAFDLIHPEDRERAINAFADTLSQPGAVRRIEYRHRHKNGSWLTVETAGTNLLHDPIVKGVVLNIREISERKRLQEQLQQATKMEAVGVLAGGVAHDFNNLLSVIAGYTELLMEEMPPDNPQYHDLEQIAKAGEHAASLTSQLLAFSRKQILQPKILNLNDIVEGMNKMLPRIIGEDIEYASIAQPDLAPIYADPGQLHQIIMNLAVNARDAMPKGGKLTIETANVNFEKDHFQGYPMVEAGPYVMLAVSDNGMGMDAETQARIFEPFFTTKGQGRGTGLGLATVYGIVKQSKGFIWVYSEPEKGTTIKIYFPRAEGAISKLADVNKPETSLRGSGTVLVVEDEASVRALVCRILCDRGYDVIEAEDGMNAVRIAQAHPGKIDLIVTDSIMPGISGKDMVTQIEATRPGIKSLFISGYTDATIVHHGILDSDVAFLQKPFTVESLLRKIEEVMGS